MTGNTDGLSATPSSFSGYPNRPVEQVSWDDMQVFLDRLNDQQSANMPAELVCPAYRVAVGICLSRGYDHSILVG